MQTYVYDSFGKLKDLKNRIKQPYTFTGREFDRETGLYFNRARYYDAEVGRFTTRDPIGVLGGLNAYLYVNGRPITYMDPMGLFSTSDFVQHYFYGNGIGLDLGAVGLLGAFRSSSSVVGAVSGFRELLKLEAVRIAQDMCYRCPAAAQTTSFSKTNNTGTDVTNEPGLFAVGHSTFFRNGNCQLSVNCPNRSYAYFCSMNFGIKDWFRDPIGMGIESPGGTPYRIDAGWTEDCSGSGSF